MNIGVIGSGQRMGRVLELLFRENSEHKIVSVYDPDFQAIQKFKSKFGDFVVEDSYEKVITNSEISWVFIGSFNHIHKDQVLLSLKSGKNVFCEKPLGISFGDLYKMKKLFNKKKQKFLISYPLRHSIHYKKINELIEAGNIGKLISLEFNEVLPFNHGLFIMGDWRRFTHLSGGHLLEKCCHDFDIINWLVKSKAKKVSSFGGRDFFNRENAWIYDKLIQIKGDLVFSSRKLRNSFLMKKDIIDNQVAIIEYENGVRASFHTNCNSQIPERRIYFCGTEGTIRSDLLRGQIEVKRYDSDELVDIVFDKKVKESHGGGDEHLAKEINLAMTSQFQRKEDFDDSIKSALTTILCDEARRKNKVVNLGKYWKKLGYN